MKVSELQGVELDFWVAKADGKFARIVKRGNRDICEAAIDEHYPETPVDEYAMCFNPSESWEDAGPILEREIKSIHCDGGKMMAINHDGTPGWGKTYPEAACRAYVASKFGREVSQPPTNE